MAKKKGKDTMLRCKVVSRSRGMRGECPVACGGVGGLTRAKKQPVEGARVWGKRASSQQPVQFESPDSRVAVPSYVRGTLSVYSCKADTLKP